MILHHPLSLIQTNPFYKHHHTNKQTKSKKFAQELLSTFSLSLGEVALQPSTGGTFIVTIYHASTISSSTPPSIQSTTLWDRKTDGGFPETKELKRRVRDVIDPTRDLGHVDRNHRAPAAAAPAAPAVTVTETKIAGDAKEGENQQQGQGQEKKQDESASGAVVCEDCN
jgi:predicted Rdx family selenoprotein